VVKKIPPLDRGTAVLKRKTEAEQEEETNAPKSTTTEPKTLENSESDQRKGVRHEERSCVRLILRA